MQVLEEEVKEVVDSLPRKWVNRAVVWLATLVAAMSVAGFALGSGWVRGVDARETKLEDRVQKNEVDIRGLAVATENLRQAVQQESAEHDLERPLRDERAHRMDRLLAILEQQAYNRTKEGSK